MPISPSHTRLDALPAELIAHIATFVEALSILNLSQTCTTIRRACWDPLIFKTVLQRSQRDHFWNTTCTLDLEAVAQRAGNDTSIWARYAVADDKACVLAAMEDCLTSRKKSINFLPELAVVKHPILFVSGWGNATHGPFDYLTSHVFSFTLAQLFGKMLDRTYMSLTHNPMDCDECFPEAQWSDSAFISGPGCLWIICSIVDTLDLCSKTQRQNNTKHSWWIDRPFIRELPLRPWNNTYTVPLPFSHTPMDLLNRQPSFVSTWEQWYRLHSHAMFSSPEFMTDGMWCGYYMMHDPDVRETDPPMIDIYFRRTRVANSAINQTVTVEATDCKDGVGHFDIRGQLVWDGSAVHFTARKHYVAGHSWAWDCRLTPFGLVGQWGQSIEDGQPAVHAEGGLWLWKKAWTDGSDSQHGDEK